MEWTFGLSATTHSWNCKLVLPGQYNSSVNCKIHCVGLRESSRSNLAKALNAKIRSYSLGHGTGVISLSTSRNSS